MELQALRVTSGAPLYDADYELLFSYTAILYVRD